MTDPTEPAPDVFGMKPKADLTLSGKGLDHDHKFERWMLPPSAYVSAWVEDRRDHEWIICTRDKCGLTMTRRYENDQWEPIKTHGSEEPEKVPVGLRNYFDFRDWWVGYYRGDRHHYVLLLPTLVIRWNRRRLADGVRATHLSPEGNTLCEVRDGEFIQIAEGLGIGGLGDRCNYSDAAHRRMADEGEWARWGGHPEDYANMGRLDSWGAALPARPQDLTPVPDVEQAPPVPDPWAVDPLAVDLSEHNAVGMLALPVSVTPLAGPITTGMMAAYGRDLRVVQHGQNLVFQRDTTTLSNSTEEECDGE